MCKFDAKKIKNDLIRWLINWEYENAQGCNFIVGISGGKDSSVVAALLVEAFGKNRVAGVLMPNGEQSDIDDAIKLCDHLDIQYCTINIGNTIKTLCVSLPPLSEQAIINLPPRIRMATLYAVSQSMNGRVANTCNLSEDYVGYSTRWGDSVGDFSPLANLTSDEVVAIGDACGLPYELTHKIPSDGLCGKTDEDNLGFTYAVLNKYIRTGICEDETVKARIDAMHQKNLFKLQMMPSFPYKED